MAWNYVWMLIRDDQQRCTGVIFEAQLLSLVSHSHRARPPPPQKG